MESSIAGGQPIDAAYLAMDNPAFYRSWLKNFVTPWTNEDRSVFDELNDYTATVIGLVRDEAPFTDVLSADVVYVGAPGVVNATYSHTDNDHYRQLEDAHVDLSDPNVFMPVAQSGLAGTSLMSSETAGIITTRAAGKAYFSAGTNRRMLRFVAVNYLCQDLEELKDITRPVDRIRQDVSRSPGGDSQLFHNQCSGCHSGMDPMAGAFAYFEWNEEQQRVVYTRGTVQQKHLINGGVFPPGYVTVDDRWDNRWRSGPNALLGWRAADSGGYGPKSFGTEIASSRAFSVCQVQKAFEQVCFRPPQTPEEIAEVRRIADVFEAQNYSMKRVLAETASYCMGN